MKSKLYKKFLNRTAHMLADVELVDVFNLYVTTEQIKGTKLYLFDILSPEQHSILSKRTSNKFNRTFAIRHLKSTIANSIIKELYEEATLYLRSLLEYYAKAGLDGNRLIGEHKIELKANDILSKRDINDVYKIITDDLFQKLEAVRSTIELLRKINSKLGLDIKPEVFNYSLPYFELRHIIVHNDGIANEQFRSRFPQFQTNAQNRVIIGYNDIRNAINCVNGLIKVFDESAIRTKIFKDDFIGR